MDVILHVCYLPKGTYSGIIQSNVQLTRFKKWVWRRARMKNLKWKKKGLQVKRDSQRGGVSLRGLSLPSLRVLVINEKKRSEKTWVWREFISEASSFTWIQMSNVRIKSICLCFVTFLLTLRLCIKSNKHFSKYRKILFWLHISAIANCLS